MSGVSKVAAERNQRILLELASKPGNDVCADCKARAPRWASHNLGIFICVNCASIHRKIGTHITKVKSLTMDSWSREQIEVMKSIGNIACNVKYNPDEIRHPPPANREESERDSELEKYIRAKYEFKRFIITSNKIQNTSNASSQLPNRQQTFPPVSIARGSSPLPPLPSDRTSTLPLPSPIQPTLPALNSPEQSATHSPTSPSQHSVRSPAPVSLAPTLSPSSTLQVPAPSTVSFTPSVTPATPQPPSSHPVWDDIMSLTAPPRSTTFSMTPSLPQEQPAMQPTPPAPGSQWMIPQFPSSAPGMIANGQPTFGSPFNQQQVGFPGQSMSSFQQGASNMMPMQPTFNQTSVPYNAPIAYVPQQHTFMPSSFPQPSFVQSPSPQPVFPEQMRTQVNNPYGVSWQQQGQSFSGQNQYGGQWGSM